MARGAEPETDAISASADVRTPDGARVPDAELARRIAGPARDAAAEAELARRFAPRIRLYGLKHLRDEERARDLVQSVLLSVLESVRMGKLDDPELVDRFVLGTARNLALRAGRTEQRARSIEDADLDRVAVLPATDALDAAALEPCLEALDARGRAVLYLTFNREKSAEEIARALDTTAGNVRVLRHRAVAQLRGCLEPAEAAS
jgi:RNA polymerase sigma-70 factor (ECF subfamily)